MNFDGMTRQEKIDYCRKSSTNKKYNPALRHFQFEALDDIRLDAWVRWFKFESKGKE
jgi:hypothetical protein